MRHQALPTLLPLLIVATNTSAFAPNLPSHVRSLSLRPSPIAPSTSTSLPSLTSLQLTPFDFPGDPEVLTSSLSSLNVAFSDQGQNLAGIFFQAR